MRNGADKCACVAVCCSVLRCVVVCCTGVLVLQCVAVCCSVLQCMKGPLDRNTCIAL